MMIVMDSTKLYKVCAVLWIVAGVLATVLTVADLVYSLPIIAFLGIDILIFFCALVMLSLLVLTVGILMYKRRFRRVLLVVLGMVIVSEICGVVFFLLMYPSRRVFSFSNSEISGLLFLLGPLVLSFTTCSLLWKQVGRHI